jgi:hypothetical protein
MIRVAGYSLTYEKRNEPMSSQIENEGCRVAALIPLVAASSFPFRQALIAEFTAAGLVWAFGYAGPGRVVAAIATEVPSVGAFLSGVLRHREPLTFGSTTIAVGGCATPRYSLER